MGNFLDENITTQIQEVFSSLVNPVEILLVFTSKRIANTARIPGY